MKNLGKEMHKIRDFTMRVKKIIKAGLGIFETNVRIQWNPVNNAFHRIRCCGNKRNC